MRPVYPDARTEDITDCLAGVRYQDPYRWLESDTEETRAWQRQQAQLVEASLTIGIPTEQMRKLVASLSVERYVALPRNASDVWFRIDNDYKTARVLVSEEPFGEGKVLLDLGSESCAGRASVSWLSPSPNAQLLAVGVCL